MPAFAIALGILVAVLIAFGLGRISLPRKPGFKGTEDPKAAWPIIESVVASVSDAAPDGSLFLEAKRSTSAILLTLLHKLNIIV